MDDGGTQTSGTLQIHTNSFTEEEVQTLVGALVSKFGIAARKTFKRPGQWMITIPVAEQPKLHRLVGHFIHSSMVHKIIR